MGTTLADYPTTRLPDSEDRVWQELRAIFDPEIPTISIVDLGVVHRVEVDEEEARVALLPTFVACPAIEVIRQEVEERITAMGVAPRVRVGLTFAEQWSSERITPAGHAALRAAGFAPPEDAPAFTASDVVDLNPLGRVRAALPTCPYCGSKNTLQENRFGPTLCRSIYYCNGCRQPFEAFKAV